MMCDDELGMVGTIRGRAARCREDKGVVLELEEEEEVFVTSFILLVLKLAVSKKRETCSCCCSWLIKLFFCWSRFRGRANLQDEIMRRSGNMV